MKKRVEIPKFRSESEEADWWASRAGRDYVKDRSAEGRLKGAKPAGSHLLTQVKKRSVQIAIRLPEGDLDQARKIAGRKGIGYQTLLKMLVHEGLQREAKQGDRSPN
jgi:predicted DNA binding CopG/RHH family protein